MNASIVKKLGRPRERATPCSTVFLGSTMPPTNAIIASRFWGKVNKKGPLHPLLGTSCWLWTAGGRPYGAFKVRGVKVNAHRFVLELETGSLPLPLCVCHRCDVPLCVRPHHLFLGTRAANVRDMDRKGRSRRVITDGFRYGGGVGSTHPFAVLTEGLVYEARRLRASGWAVKRLAEKYGVAPSTMSEALSGKWWSRVPHPDGEDSRPVLPSPGPAPS